MVIEFYTTFSKRVNSTKRPTGSPTKSLTGYLREPCSILNPRFKIERLTADENPEGLSYAFIPNFQRYYFVNDWTWSEGLWECSLTVDTLASWKTSIGECEEYILRHDSTTDFNGAISDTMYPATTDFSIESTAFPNPFVESLSQGTYVVGIISGETANTVGAISYYAMTALQFGALKDYLFSDDNLVLMNMLDTSTDPPTPLLADMSIELLKTMYNPYQYISSCIWFPIAFEDIPGTSTNVIKLGWWDYPLSGKRVSTQIIALTETATMPEHPQVLRGKYLDYAPYTRRILFGKFGAYPVDTSYMEVGTVLFNYYIIDLITGRAKVQFYVAENNAGLNRKLLGETDFLLGVPIQIAQIGVDYLGTAVNLIDTAKHATGGMIAGGILGGVAGNAIFGQNGIAGGAVTGAVAGAILSAGGSVYNTIESAMPQMRTSGTNGSFISADVSTVLISQFFVITDEDITHKGRPLFAKRIIKNLNGFVQCADGDIQFPCMIAEKRIIGEHFTSGFFWE